VYTNGIVRNKQENTVMKNILAINVNPLIEDGEDYTTVEVKHSTPDADFVAYVSAKTGLDLEIMEQGMTAQFIDGAYYTTLTLA